MSLNPITAEIYEKLYFLHCFPDSDTKVPGELCFTELSITNQGIAVKGFEKIVLNAVSCGGAKNETSDFTVPWGD
jgi:hypothetical protein